MRIDTPAEAIDSRTLRYLPGRQLGTSDCDLEPGDIYLARDVGGVTRVHDRVARAGSVRAALYGVAAARGVRVGYPDEVRDEVEAWLARPGTDDPALHDLTALPFITIDNADSRDLDQAMHIETVGGLTRVRYALADASWYVRPGSALLAEALLRGVSYYLPGVSFPMLPPALSEGLISLNPGVVRRAVVMTLSVDASGRCTEATLTRARVRSVAKLSYDEVQAFYDAPERSPLAGQQYTPVLDGLRTVGRTRVAEGEARDVVAYQRMQVEVRLGDADGAAFELLGDQRNDCERYNEQLSLLCNIEGAAMLGVGGLPIWRVHPAPPDERLARLADVVQAISRAYDLQWDWRPQHLPGGDTVAALLRLVRATAPIGVQRAVERLAMVSNVRSVFTTERGPHHGVGAAAYARFSAPMRELVGIYTHAEALRLAGVPSWSQEPTEALREAVIEAGNTGQDRQRELTKAANKLVLDHFFAADLARDPIQRPWYGGTVLELSPTRAYVLLNDPPVEIKVYSEDLGAHTQLLAGGAALRLEGGPLPSLLLGQALDVQVAAQSAERWRFTLRAAPGAAAGS